MKKYKKGEPIKSLEELMEQEFIIHKIGATEKTLHSSWFQNWQLRWANQYINKKVLYKAIKIGKGEQICASDILDDVIKLGYRKQSETVKEFTKLKDENESLKKQLENTKSRIYISYEKDRAKIRSLKFSVEDSIVDYRIKSACRVLDHIHTKSFGDKGIDNKELHTLITHCLNKLNGNIDGIELEV